MKNFSQLGLNPALLQALTELGFENPTEIQQEAIPHILQSDQDLVALAQTGTGKTGAFGIPLIQKIKTDSPNTQVLILSPTRELALQIKKDLDTFAKHSKVSILAVFGGDDIRRQIQSLKRGAQIVVGTPGRVQDLINRQMLKLQTIDWLVLDEADEMLNMGFKDEIDQILKSTSPNKKTLLFSATMPAEIARITQTYMKDYYEISIGNKNSSSKNIKHIYYKIPEKFRYEALRRILDFETDIYGIVFCKTKAQTQEIAVKLMNDGYLAEAIHGDLSQNQRTTAMNRLRSRQIKLLIATDVAARGIDIKNLSHVINYNLPDSLETYTHRSGRTGRADEKGISIAIVNLKENRILSLIERKAQIKFEKKLIPTQTDLVNSQLASLKDTVASTEISNEAKALFASLNHTEADDLTLKLLTILTQDIYKKFTGTFDINETRESSGSYRNSGQNPRQAKRNFQSKPNITFVKAKIMKGRDQGFHVKEFFNLIRNNPKLRRAEIGEIQIRDTYTEFEIQDIYAKFLR